MYSRSNSGAIDNRFPVISSIFLFSGILISYSMKRFETRVSRIMTVLSVTISLALDNRDCASLGLYETFSKYIIYLCIIQYYVKTKEINFAKFKLIFQNTHNMTKFCGQYRIKL